MDGTLGGGGHAEAILEQTGPDGLLIGLDLDGEAIAEAGKRLAPFGQRVRLIQASFRRIADLAADLAPVGIDGIVSISASPHISSMNPRAVSASGPATSLPSTCDSTARVRGKALESCWRNAPRKSSKRSSPSTASFPDPAAWLAPSSKSVPWRRSRRRRI